MLYFTKTKNWLNGVSTPIYGSSLQPYDPARALGDTTPGTIKPPKDDKGCGIVGAVFLTVIAVAVTVATYGKGAKVGLKIAAAALGSAVSQAVGVATGIQDKFSFKGVALAGLSAGVSAGIGEIGGSVGKALGGSSIGSSVARGVVSSAVTQGIATATGLQSSFSWAGVAAAGVGAATGHVAQGALEGTGLGTFTSDVATTSASAITIAATRSAITGTSFARSIELALPDAIGQAIGRAVGGEVSKAIAGSRDPAQVADAVKAGTDPALQQSGAIINLDPTASNSFTIGGSVKDVLESEFWQAYLSDAKNSVVAQHAPLEHAAAMAREHQRRQEQLGASGSATSPATRFESDEMRRYVSGDTISTSFALRKFRTQIDELRAGLESKSQAYRNDIERLEADYLYYERYVGELTAVADAEVGKVLFVGIGAPALLGGGAAFAPAAGLFAQTQWGAGTIGYYGASSATGGAFGAALEYSKNEVFDLEHTPGGYASSIAFGGLGGTGFQITTRLGPLADRVATGAVIGGAGDLAGQFIENWHSNEQIDVGQALISSAIGSFSGLLIPNLQVQGINSGRNNTMSIYRGLNTRFDNGNIGQVRLRYSTAAGAASQVGGSVRSTAEAGYTGMIESARKGN